MDITNRLKKISEDILIWTRLRNYLIDSKDHLPDSKFFASKHNTWAKVTVCLGNRAHTCLLSLQSCLTLCDPMDYSPPSSSIHGILQAKKLEWVAMPSSRESSDPGIEPASLKSPALAGRFFTTSPTWEAPGNTVSLYKFQETEVI